MVTCRFGTALPACGSIWRINPVRTQRLEGGAQGVWNILVSLGVEHTHLRPEQIRPDAEWDRDLGID
jgi:hypothetical protein